MNKKNINNPIHKIIPKEEINFLSYLKEKKQLIQLGLFFGIYLVF